MANVWTANWDALSTGVTWTTSTPAGWSPLTIGGQLTQETYTGLAGSPPTQSSQCLTIQFGNRDNRLYLARDVGRKQRRFCDLC
jgi:hypothetical protein